MRSQKLFNTALARPGVRFLLPALIALACLAMPQAAKASCGYYVIIGHPGAEAAEQVRMRQEQMPLDHKKAPCNGPQCRQNDRPINPAQVITVLSHDAMALSVTIEASITISYPAPLDQLLLLSDPHIWRIDPPPRA